MAQKKNLRGGGSRGFGTFSAAFKAAGIKTGKGASGSGSGGKRESKSR